MKKNLFYLYLAMMLVCTAASCTKEEPIFEGYDSTVNIDEDVKNISFNIQHIWKELSEGEHDINLCLTGLNGNNTVLNLAATLSRHSEISSRITMSMSPEENIPDGTYMMSVSVNGWYPKSPFVIKFKLNHIINIITQNDAYRVLAYDTRTGCHTIQNDTDFSKFLSALAKDPNKGANTKFRQTCDIDWNEMKKSLSPGLEHRTSFAGSYDGGGHKIYNISYKGNGTEDDKEVGLFSTLLNGAEIKNLTIENHLSFTDIYSDGGLVAGKAQGTVKLSDLNVTGSFTCNKSKKSDYIGGLIGSVTDAKIAISEVTLNVEMSNMGKYIGGLIGYVENSTVNISQVYTPNFEIDIYAVSDAGGFIGSVRNSSFNIKTSALNHAATAEMPGYFKIEVSDKNVGGAIGSIQSLSGNSEFSGVDIRVPVGADEDDAEIYNVGGFVGYAELKNLLTINNCFLGASVGGNNHVGGFIGRCITTGNDCLKFSGITKISPQRGSDVKITGKSYIGGFIGKLEGNDQNTEFAGKSNLAANVTGTGDYVGGYIGYIDEAKIKFHVASENLLDSMVVIRTSGNYVGGLAGAAKKTTVEGNNSTFNFNNGIPKFESFKTNICCTVNGNKYVGGAFGHVNQCTIHDLAVKTSVHGGEYTGGIFGYIHFHHDVEINRCVHDGFVKGTANNTGGISGYSKNNGKLQYCINYGNVEAKDNCGGVIGKVDYFDNPPYTNYCVNVGNVSGTGDVGGIVGFMDGQQDCSSWTKIVRCGNYGSVYSSGGGSNGVGGILGRCKQRHGNILNCANHGNVSGSAQQAGGIVGWMGRDPSGVYQTSNIGIRYCANFGNVNSSHSNAYVGGISGYNEEGSEGSYTHSHLQACYNCGEILPDPSSDTGGILGYADHYSATEDCINYGKVHHGNVGVGTRKSSAIIDVVDIYFLKGTGKTWRVDDDNVFTEDEMSTQSNFKGLNWTEHWVMGYSAYSSSNQHPVLQNCPFQNISWEK